MPPVEDLGSEVSLEKDILPPKPREFFPTFAEWISDGNAEQIVRNAFSNDGTDPVIFEVPVNKTFFMTGCSFVALNSDIGTQITTAQIRYGNASPFQTFLLLVVEARASGSNSSNSINFSMPIKIEGGNTIVLTSSGSSSRNHGTIYGFLLDKKISIR